MFTFFRILQNFQEATFQGDDRIPCLFSIGEFGIFKNLITRNTRVFKFCRSYKRFILLVETIKVISMSCESSTER